MLTAGHGIVGDDMLDRDLYAKQYAGEVSDPAKTIVLFAGWRKCFRPIRAVKKIVSAGILKEEMDGREEMMLLLSLCMIVVLLASWTLGNWTPLER